MTTFEGSDNNIQRKVRRAYDYLKTRHPIAFKLFPGGFLASFLKAIFIATDEDYTDFVESDGHAIEIDTTTESELEPVPFDEDI